MFLFVSVGSILCYQVIWNIIINSQLWNLCVKSTVVSSQGSILDNYNFPHVDVDWNKDHYKSGLEDLTCTYSDNGYDLRVKFNI